MRRYEFAGHAHFMRHIWPALGGPDFRIVAKVRDQLVVFVKDGYAPVQVGHKKIAISLIKVAGPPELVGDEPDVFALERKVLQPVGAAVGHHDDRLRSPGVDPDSMRALELAGCAALSSPGSDVLGL